MTAPTRILLTLLGALLGACSSGGDSPATDTASTGAQGGPTPLWQQLDQQYYYAGGDLGLRYERAAERAEFAVWAPTADTVLLQLYAAGNHEQPFGEARPMRRDADSGVWRLSLGAAELDIGSLLGLFYQYRVDGRPALDPYARSMAVDAGSVGKAAIVDLDRYEVAGFAAIDGYRQREDAIIYEVHVRDFTVDPAVEHQLGDAPFGTYTAFIAKLPYIRSLGVTHVQLLPVMAYFYGDESRAREREWNYVPENNNYNWGYDPHSYFAPEGMYASDPSDPQARVDELKALVDAIHAAGMGVILDVVYNHHPHDGIYEPLVPGYYYRGRNDSFAGTDIASERAMARKLIVDSLRYWTEEYKVDGYRFDLMGLIDTQTIREGYEAVAALNPDTLFIGEGWRMFQGDGPPMATQDWVLEQDFAAVFSDDFRDIVKSGYNTQGTPRFITGGAEPIDVLFSNIKGQPTSNFRTDDPGDAVQYIAAHDNLTLHDVISVSTGLDPDEPAQRQEIHRRIRLGNALLLTSQGIAFLHAGQEYGRSKRWLGDGVPGEAMQGPTGDVFVENSYDSADVVNFIDWTLIETDPVGRATIDYTRGLIALRRSSEAFRLGSQERVDALVRLLASPDIAAEDRVIGFETGTEGGERFLVVVNADSVARELRVDFDPSAGDVLVDGARAGIEPIAVPAGVTLAPGLLRIDPLTATVVRLPAASG